MSRAGLSTPALVTAAADLADETGYHNLTMGRLADRLGVRAPSLYKHVSGLADVRHRVAVLALTQLGDSVRDAVGGLAGHEALAAFAAAFHDFITRCPGRYAATIGARSTGAGDPLTAASARVLGTIAAGLTGYGIPPTELTHALRALRSMFHGFATLHAARAFHLCDDPYDTFGAMVDLIDRGLRQ